MTAITPERSGPEPCLIAAPTAGPIIGVLFAVTVLLFLLAVVTLAA